MFIIKTFWIGPWNHIGPDEEFDSEGKRVIIRKLCFGPLETIEYGVTNESIFFMRIISSRALMKVTYFLNTFLKLKY